MNERELIYKDRFGFHQKYSTQQAIISLIDKITKSLDYGDIAIGVLFLFEKAFDTVKHKIFCLWYPCQYTKMIC